MFLGIDAVTDHFRQLVFVVRFFPITVAGKMPRGSSWPCSTATYPRGQKPPRVSSTTRILVSVSADACPHDQAPMTSGTRCPTVISTPGYGPTPLRSTAIFTSHTPLFVPKVLTPHTHSPTYSHRYTDPLTYSPILTHPLPHTHLLTCIPPSPGPEGWGAGLPPPWPEANHRE